MLIFNITERNVLVNGSPPGSAETWRGGRVELDANPHFRRRTGQLGTALRTPRSPFPSTVYKEIPFFP